MNDQFDELAKGLAQSATRRGALKKLGLGLAGISLAAFGLTNKVSAAPKPGGPGDRCSDSRPCSTGLFCCPKSLQQLNVRYCSFSPCVYG